MQDRRISSSKDKVKRGLKKLLPQMTRQKGPTQVLVTGVDTFSTSIHSFTHRLKFWKPGCTKSAESACEGYRSRKMGHGPDAKSQSNVEAESRTNPLRMHSLDQERATHENVEIMIAPSVTSIPRSTPILMPGNTKAFRGRGCCSLRGKANQEDRNVGAVKDAPFLDTYSVSGDSVVRIDVGKTPVLSARHFTKDQNSLPGDVQALNPEREYFPIDKGNLGDPKICPEGLQSTEPSPNILRVPDEMDFLVSSEIICPPGLDNEAELTEAMESPSPKLETVQEIKGAIFSPDVPALETTNRPGEGSEISLTGSFIRTRSSLSSIDGHSAPSHSFHIEKPYSHLGSDFVDIEEYLMIPSDSLPHPPYPALDSSATTEDFGFGPTRERMPGSWPGDGPPALMKCEKFPTTAIRLLTPDLGETQGFIMSHEEVVEELKQELPPQTGASLSFWRCRPALDPLEENSSSSGSPPLTGPDRQATLHQRGGGDEARFSLFRTPGKGKLVGNLERGKQLLNEEVSGNYMVGGWGRNETWKEFFVKMEKRVERRKGLTEINAEIEKLKTQKKGKGVRRSRGL